MGATTSFTSLLQEHVKSSSAGGAPATGYSALDFGGTGPAVPAAVPASAPDFSALNRWVMPSPSEGPATPKAPEMPSLLKPAPSPIAPLPPAPSAMAVVLGACPARCPITGPVIGPVRHAVRRDVV